MPAFGTPLCICFHFIIKLFMNKLIISTVVDKEREQHNLTVIANSCYAMKFSKINIW
jgi:hypothetical protein